MLPNFSSELHKMLSKLKMSKFFRIEGCKFIHLLLPQSSRIFNISIICKSDDMKKFKSPLFELDLTETRLVTSHLADVDVSEENNSDRKESVDTGNRVRVEAGLD